MALDGFIFDLDGVLIDSNQAHIDAWSKALRAHGYKVGTDRIAVEIGKGGDQLVSGLLGERAEEEAGEQLRKAEKEEFISLALSRGLAAHPGGEALIAALKQRGLKVALATSSGEEQLEVAEKASGVAWRALMDEVVTAKDVEQTKPAPDLVSTAVRKLGLAPGQCAMVGDSAWDARSAMSAGVVLLGVTSGGRDVATLRREGARRVVADVAEAERMLDDILQSLSPAALHLDAATQSKLMALALEEAERGLIRGNVPMGALLADGEGRVLATGHNEVSALKDLTAHAGMQAFRKLARDSAAKGDPLSRPALFFVSTVEPCVMCLGAAWEWLIDTIVFGAPSPNTGGSARFTSQGQPAERPRPRMVGSVCAKESWALLQRWGQTGARPMCEWDLVDGLLGVGA